MLFRDFFPACFFRQTCHPVEVKLCRQTSNSQVCQPFCVLVLKRQQNEEETEETMKFVKFLLAGSGCHASRSAFETKPTAFCFLFVCSLPYCYRLKNHLISQCCPCFVPAKSWLGSFECIRMTSLSLCSDHCMLARSWFVKLSVRAGHS